jgi:hypothetical protein
MFIACYGNYKNIRHGLPLIGIVNLLLGEFGSGTGNNQESKRKQIATPSNMIFIHQIPPNRKSFQLLVALDMAINENKNSKDKPFICFISKSKTQEISKSAKHNILDPLEGLSRE